MKLALISLLVVASYVGTCVAHSWIACSDYLEANGGDWDPEKCRGFARDSAQYAQKESFGLDRGFDHKPGQQGKVCKTDYKGTSYSDTYPMAVYYPGQQVVLVHPMKNHGATSCSNIYIPDHGSWVYHGGARTNGPISDYNANVVSYLGASKFGTANVAPDTYPKEGYQNAPKFCDGDTDKAMATYMFNVPDTLAPGEYTFVWTWSFNGPTDMYSGCFDVIVASNKEERDTILQSRDASINLFVPCGGMLSNGGEGSCPSSNASTSTPAPTPPATPAPSSSPATSSTSPPTSSTTTTVATPPTTTTVATPPTSSTTTTVATPPTSSPATPSTTTTTDYGDDTDGDDSNGGGYVITNPNNDGGFCLPVQATQFSGSIEVGKPPVSVVSRKIKLDLVCDVESIVVFNGRVLDERGDDGCYYVIQDDIDDVRSGVVKFMITYESCDFARYKPRAKLVGEKRKN